MANSKVKVDGLAFYACILRPNKESGAFCVDLAVDEDTSNTLKGLGLQPAKRQDGTKVTHEDTGMDVFRFKKKLTDRNGKALTKPQLVDSSGNPLDVLVGNGSKVRLYGSAFSYTFKGRSGVSGGLDALQVIELNEVSFFDKIEGGFTSDKPVEVVKDDTIDIDTDII